MSYRQYITLLCCTLTIQSSYAIVTSPQPDDDKNTSENYCAKLKSYIQQTISTHYQAAYCKTQTSSVCEKKFQDEIDRLESRSHNFDSCFDHLNIEYFRYYASLSYFGLAYTSLFYGGDTAKKIRTFHFKK